MHELVHSTSQELTVATAVGYARKIFIKPAIGFINTSLQLWLHFNNCKKREKILLLKWRHDNQDNDILHKDSQHYWLD
jgi:hypothetical protein